METDKTRSHGQPTDHIDRGGHRQHCQGSYVHTPINTPDMPPVPPDRLTLGGKPRDSRREMGRCREVQLRGQPPSYRLCPLDVNWAYSPAFQCLQFRQSVVHANARDSVLLVGRHRCYTCRGIYRSKPPPPPLTPQTPNPSPPSCTSDRWLRESEEGRWAHASVGSFEMPRL